MINIDFSTVEGEEAQLKAKKHVEFLTQQASMLVADSMYSLKISPEHAAALTVSAMAGALVMLVSGYDEETRARKYNGLSEYFAKIAEFKVDIVREKGAEDEH